MKNAGMTFVELLVSVAVVGSLIMLSYFSFEKWMAKYIVEKSTRDLYADMMHTRITAMARCRDYYLVLDQASYTMYEDRNEDGDPDEGEEVPAYPKKVKQALHWNGSGAAFTFDKRGQVTPNRTIWFVSGANPDSDCMRVSRTRILIGKSKHKENGEFEECEIH